MDILEKEKLLLFVLFVIPGFVSLKFYELFFPSQKNESSKQLIDAVTYSCINYALMFYPIIWFFKDKNRNTFVSFVFYILILFIAPIIWVWVWKIIRNSDTFQKNMPHPIGKPWDYVFGLRRLNWVIVTLKDGTKIGGNYDSQSFSSSSPAIEQLYLEECWVINEDGGFERRREDSDGILILSNEIVTIEFFKKTQTEEA